MTFAVSLAWFLPSCETLAAQYDVGAPLRVRNGAKAIDFARDSRQPSLPPIPDGGKKQPWRNRCCCAAHDGKHWVEDTPHEYRTWLLIARKHERL